MVAHLQARRVLLLATLTILADVNAATVEVACYYSIKQSSALTPAARWRWSSWTHVKEAHVLARVHELLRYLGFPILIIGKVHANNALLGLHLMLLSPGRRDEREFVFQSPQQEVMAFSISRQTQLPNACPIDNLCKTKTFGRCVTIVSRNPE